MRKLIYLTILLLSSALNGLTIYDVQHTTNPGSDGTYPSPHVNQIVTLTGIVTADNFSSNRFFISMPEGGAWKGIYIYHSYSVNVGDKVTVTGKVTEYWGFTELKNVSNVTIISSGHSVAPTLITTGQLNTNEAYESVLVKIVDAQVVESYDQYNNFKINDGTGSSYVGVGCVDLQNHGFDAIVGSMLTSITGVVDYSFNNYYLNPRSINDVIIGEMPITIATDDMFINTAENFQLPLLIFNNGSVTINDFHIELSYNNNMVEFIGLDYSNSILANCEVSSTSNTITADYSGSAVTNSNSTLFNLVFYPIGMGHTSFYAFNCTVNGEDVDSFNFGNLNISLASTDQGDILTTVQRPILAIPAITRPNETFEIWASAPPATTGWDIYLKYEDYQLPLEVLSTYYDSTREWHVITIQTPTPQFYELFNLYVDAPTLELDEVKNAVKIEPTLDDEWYFIHISDTHLPTHLFSHDSNYYNDMTEVEDFLTVIEDINALNPKFVLLTGDVVNEGELEDYLDARYYSIAKNTLGMLESPVYLVSGNHDIGGWQGTPMPAGNARSNWYNFFGWDILENPNGLYPLRTQNYTFTYNDVKFLGLESYINYDNYLPHIFGDESFTNGQLSWLNAQVATAEATKVLFYHHDFSDQINLYNLNVEMALSGHTHSDSGNINSSPYNLKTASICDGNRKYRVIKVNNGVLEPLATVSAGSYGQNFQVNFELPNHGMVTSNVAQIVNMHNIEFADVLVKFKMPLNSSNFSVINGEISQIVELNDKKIVHVKTLVAANSVLDVSIQATTSNSQDVNEVTTNLSNVLVFPNPSNPANERNETTISFDLKNRSKVSLSVYNLKGQKVEQVCQNKLFVAGHHNIAWVTSSQLSSGIYLLKLNTESESKLMKFINIK
ncbi:MAG: metallophosphoesterase [Candidatus Cloacimonadales bacterium]